MHMLFNTMMHGHSSHQFENKDTIFQVRVVSDQSYELFYCLDISVIHILTKPGNLFQWHCGFFGGIPNDWV